MPRPAVARVRLMLHVLFASSVLAGAGGVVTQIVTADAASVVASVVLLGIAVAAWWFRMTGRYPRVASLVLSLCAVGIVALVDTLGLPLLFTALVVLVVDWGMWLGVAMVLVTNAVMAVMLYDAAGGDLGLVVGQSILNSSLFVLILLFGGLLRAFDRQQAELLDANVKLTEAMDASRDLVLAEERARAAAELHDGLGHQLTLVSMSLDFAERMRDRDPARAWAEVGHGSAIAKQALADMRLWVRALHPARLDQLTEPSAFEAVADAFRGTGIEVRVEVGSDERLDRPQALFAYRLIQEGLTNALRHARATEVVFGIERDAAGGLKLAVGDNGAGVADTDGLQPGYGLRGLTERAEALGGTLRLRSPGRLGGLDVIAELPAVTP